MSVQQLQSIISPKFTENVVRDIITKKSALTDIQIIKIKIGDFSKKGDSYLSSICRFTTEASGKNRGGHVEAVSIPVIVKSLPTNLGRRKTLRSSEFFENEIIFYEKVWSAFQKFQQEEEIEEKFDNIPLVFSTHFDGENDYVAMLDLSHEGYTSAERGSGLNYEHTVAIVKLLARFHGLSLAFKEKQPNRFEKAATTLKETYCAEKFRPWYSNYQKNLINVVRDAVLKELSPEYLHRFDKLIERDLYSVVIDACVVRGPLSVVCHGDVWVPNFLIKYEGTTPGKITMIHFQFTRYTSLATDLSFFLFTCVSTEIVENQFDQLVGLYHKTLVDSMKNYGAQNSVTLEAIHYELKKYSVMGVGMSVEALTMALLDDSEVNDIDAIQGEEALPLETVFVIHPFQDPEKRRRIAAMIKLAVDRNFI